ncbi:MAG: ABC transporter ATP-binding protein [Bdellovibrionales bacterium]
MQPIIEVRGLSFDYPGLRAIDNISFTLPKGSITALVGPNGAGKTTLMKCLVGLEVPMTGTITLDGIDVLHDPAQARTRVGYLPDFFGLYEGLSVEKCMIYSALSHGIPWENLDDKVDSALHMVNLEGKKSAQVHELSRGMRQRLAIAQSLVHHPKILILDEPASGLDPEARASLAQLFRRLNREGITMLVSSHILSELSEYADHLLSMRQGRLLDQQVSITQLKRRLVVRGLPKAENFPRIEAIAPAGTNYEEGLFYFDFTGEDKELPRLLRQIVQADFEVLEFYLERDILQSKYLDQVRRESP